MRSTTALRWLAAVMATQHAVAFVMDLPHHHARRQDGSLSRSPCPGLNVLANERVLPYDGRNITAAMFKQAIMDVYNLEDLLAGLLSSAAIQLTGEPGASSIDLEDLDKHNKIEHDASLTRDDTVQGDNHSLQPKLLQALLDDAGQNGEPITVDTIAKSRKRREAESKADGSPGLDPFRIFLAYSESALLLQALGPLGGDDPNNLMVPQEALKQWIGEERLPDGWKRPNEMTILGTNALSARILAKAKLL